MIRSGYISLISLATMFLIGSCSNRKLIGEYRSSVYTSSNIIHLSANHTGYYTWWTDIQMFNEGTWTVSNDTLFFEDLSILHPSNKSFIIKKNGLIDIEKHGEIYKKMNFFQRKAVYRGR